MSPPPHGPAAAPKPIRRAMVIDDGVFDQKMYCRILERSGIVEDVISFLAADHALDYLCANPSVKIDVIFLDINMPRMDGFEFLEEATRLFGSEFAKFCVIMLTTSLDPNDRERAKSFDIVRAYMNKPLTIEEIHQVAELLRQSREDDRNTT